MKITFYGATEEVTGACFHVVLSDGTEALVDAGFYQDADFVKKNETLPSIDWRKLQAIVLTHGHLDHCGRLPAYYRAGFRGRVIATPPTCEIASIIWQDNAKLLADHARIMRTEPLYNTQDATDTERLFEAVEYGKEFAAGTARGIFYDAGHILGSATVKIIDGDTGVVFSGDLGNTPDAMLPPTVHPKTADAVVMETTYGDRLHHTKRQRLEELKAIIDHIIQQKGTLLIPAFAIERSQSLLHDLNDLVEEGRIPAIPVFLDSPMAIRVVDVFEKHRAYLNKEMQDQFRGGDDPFKFNRLKLTKTVDESKGINLVPGPKIIIAGSGMMTGGRVTHHLKRVLPDPRSMVLIVGYQVTGTLGRHIEDGQKNVSVAGRNVPVSCEVRKLDAYSGHADQKQLLDWLGGFSPSPRHTILIHGSPEAMTAFGALASSKLAVRPEVAHFEQTIEI